MTVAESTIWSNTLWVSTKAGCLWYSPSDVAAFHSAHGAVGTGWNERKLTTRKGSTIRSTLLPITTPSCYHSKSKLINGSRAITLSFASTPPFPHMHPTSFIVAVRTRGLVTQYRSAVVVQLEKRIEGGREGASRVKSLGNLLSTFAGGRGGKG